MSKFKRSLALTGACVVALGGEFAYGEHLEDKLNKEKLACYAEVRPPALAHECADSFAIGNEIGLALTGLVTIVLAVGSAKQTHREVKRI